MAGWETQNQTPLTLSEITAKLFGRRQQDATGYDPNTGLYEFANASSTEQYNPFSNNPEGTGINPVNGARDPSYQTPQSQWGVPNTSGGTAYNPNLPGGMFPGTNRPTGIPTGSVPLPSYGRPGGAGVNPAGRGSPPPSNTEVNNPLANKPGTGINTTGFTPTPTPTDPSKFGPTAPTGSAPWQPGEHAWPNGVRPDFGPKPPGSKTGDASIIQQNAVNRAGSRSNSNVANNPLLNATGGNPVAKTGDTGNNPLTRGGEPSNTGTPPPNSNTNTNTNNQNTVVGPDGRTYNRNPNIPQGNWNQNDPNNPLRSLIPQGANPYGNAGGLLYGGSVNPGSLTDGSLAGDPNLVWNDPRYYERYWHDDGDGKGEIRYRLKPQVSQRLNGRVQVGLAGVGGDTHNVKDPSLVEWDPEFGLVTPAWNVVQDANVDWQDAALFATVGGILGGATGAHALGINQGVPGGFDINPNTGGIAGNAGTTPGGIPWSTPTGPGSTPAPTPNGPPNQPNGPPGNNGVTPPSGTTPPGPPGTPSTGPAPSWVPESLRDAWQTGRMLWNGARWVVSGIGLANTVSNLAGRGPVFGGGNRRPGNNTNNPNSNNNNNNGGGGDFDLSDLLGTGLGLYNDNRNLDWFQDQTNTLMDRGDFAREQRPAWMDRLNEMLLDPEKALNDPTYKAVRERGLDNLSRKLNARGYNMSGNEMGELQQYGQEMDWKQIQKEREALMNAVKLGDPSGMASAALRNLPFIFAARGNRNFDASNGLSGLLNWLFNRDGNNNNNVPNPFGNNTNNNNGGNTPDNQDERDSIDGNNPDNQDERDSIDGNPFPGDDDGDGDDDQDVRDSIDGNNPPDDGDGDDDDWWNWFFGDD